MTKKGHTIVNGCISLVTWIVSGDILFSLAVFLAASAPDTLEISYRSSSGYKGYSRVINHRTITHWWPLWVFLWYYSLQISFFLADITHTNTSITHYLNSFILGYAVGGIVHLSVDALSPMGIPILTPFSKSRKSLTLYSTGKTEWRVVYPIAFFTILWVISKKTPWLDGGIQSVKTIIAGAKSFI